jgi:beta-phosphoglucomutase-like phosphatase (HAD superfamily)
VDRHLPGDHLVGEPLVGPDPLHSRLVLFDLDGTLVDSTPGMWASVRAATVALGLAEIGGAPEREWAGTCMARRKAPRRDP